MYDLLNQSVVDTHPDAYGPPSFFIRDGVPSDHVGLRAPTREIRKIFFNGQLPVPSSEDPNLWEGITPSLIPFCSDDKILKDAMKFHEWLASQPPTYLIPYEDNSNGRNGSRKLAPVKIVMFPKQAWKSPDGDELVETIPEGMRRCIVEKRFSDAFLKDGSEFAQQSLGLDQLDRAYGPVSVGIGVFVSVTDEQGPRDICLGGLEIKHRAIAEAVYDGLTDPEISVEYVGKLIKEFTSKRFNETLGKLIHIFQSKEDLLSYISQEQINPGLVTWGDLVENKTSEKVIRLNRSPVLIKSGQLPVDTLLDDSDGVIKSEAISEIGQLASLNVNNGDGKSLKIPEGLYRALPGITSTLVPLLLLVLYRDILPKCPFYRVGLCSSENFLRDMEGLRMALTSGRLEQVLGGLNSSIVSVNDLLVAAEAMVNTVTFYPSQQVKRTAIQLLDGKWALLDFVFRGGSAEVAQYVPEFNLSSVGLD